MLLRVIPPQLSPTDCIARATSAGQVVGCAATLITVTPSRAYDRVVIQARIRRYIGLSIHSYLRYRVED
ncbi:MAG: hypothetical protein HND48_13180 [Chloroflexi bacterium]|nr:hypothetical protein [Chloroflexota bacterium]